MTFVSLHFLIYASVVFCEIVQIPDLGLYHVIPMTEIQLLGLNRLRTSDTGMIFIHGVGTMGEVTEVLASAKVLEYYEKELTELNLKFELEFSPVTIEMFDNTPDYNLTEQLELAGREKITFNDFEDEDQDFKILPPPIGVTTNNPREVTSDPAVEEYLDTEIRREKRDAGDMYDIKEDKDKGKKKSKGDENKGQKKSKAGDDENKGGDMYDFEEDKEQKKSKAGDEDKGKGQEKNEAGDMYDFKEDERKEKNKDQPKNTAGEMYDFEEDKGEKKSKVADKDKDQETSQVGDMYDFEEDKDKQISTKKPKAHQHTNKTAKPKATHSTKKAKSKPTKSSKPMPKTPAAPPPPNFFHNVRKLMPIEAIVPSLYSGVFLNIGAIGLGNVSLLTVGGKENSTMDNPFLCLSLENEVDPLDTAAQWLFEKSEQRNYYVLRNRKIPHAYISWEDDDEQFLVVELRREFQNRYKNPNNPLRRNVLFRVERHAPGKKGSKANPTTDQVLYELKIKGFDNDNTHIVIDPELKDTTGCLLLQRTQKEVSNDKERLKYLFRMERAISSLKIVGILGQMRYKQTPAALFKRAFTEGTVLTLETKTLFNHRNENLTADLIELHERSDTFRLVFPKSMRKSVFSEILVPPGLSIGTLDDIYSSNGNRSQSATFVPLDLGHERDTQERFKYKITGQIKLQPWKAVQYSVMFGWIDDLELNFETTVTILGRGDRMKASDPPRVVTNQVMNFRYVNEILRDINFQLGKATKASKNKNPNDPKAMYYEIPMKGKVIAKSLGIKGEVVILFHDLRRNVNTTCHFSGSN